MQIKSGIDIIEVSRIQESIDDLGEKFVKKIFTEQEIKYCESKNKNKYQHYAARFAVKEAVFKAISTLLADKYSIAWKNIETINDKNGKPVVKFVSLTKEVEKELDKITSIDVSISHIKEYAVATVNAIVERWGFYKMELFDSHAHYDDEKFENDRYEVIEKIYESGVTKFMSAGYNLESSKRGIELANKFEYIYTTSGISPNDVKEDIEQTRAEICELKNIIINYKKENRQIDKIVGIGEIGLDYYWNKENKDIQQFAFIEQIKLANELKLPIAIHTREAVMDTINILKENPVMKKGVFHCCPFNRELVKEALKLGFYISVAGPVTFKNSKNANEIINMIPIDRMLIETDSPYLAPEPVRGTRNDSRNVKYIAEKIAEFRKIPAEEVAKQTYNNAKKLYEIK